MEIHTENLKLSYKSRTKNGESSENYEFVIPLRDDGVLNTKS